MPLAALLMGYAGRRRSLTRRVAQLVALAVGGPPLLLLLAAAGVSGAPAGPEPASLAASDARQVAAVPPALRGYFLAAARAYALPPALLAAIATVESDFTPTAVGPPVAGGPALGMMQFLPSSWALFDPVPGATPFDPGPAVLAAARHLLSSGALPGGGFDPVAGLFGYNHSVAYGRQVLAIAAGYGYRYDPDRPPDDPVRYHVPLVGDPAAPGATAVACVRAAVVTTAGPAVVLRGEDGFLYRYTGLVPVAGLLPGLVVEPGTPVGITGGPFGFTIRHSLRSAPLDPAPYLVRWPTGPLPGAAR